MTTAVLMRGITKTFSQQTIANDSVDLEVGSGEIHCLLGENGAGKSTLMNILYGLYTPDSGTIHIDGKPVSFPSPSHAIAHGISMVHQHFMLIPVFTVLENIILGKEPVKQPLLDRRTAKKEIEELSQRFGLDVDLSALVQDISVAMQQRVEILKMLYRKARIMIFDEPTAVLTPQEVSDLYETMNTLKESGNTIIFITHKLKEVMDISDKVTILRHGKTVATVNTKDTTPTELTRMMVGRDVLFSDQSPVSVEGPPVLDVAHVTAKDSLGRTAVNNVSFSLHEGEILGIAGVDGNGQNELVEALTGLRSVEEGSIATHGVELAHRPTKEFFAAGIAHVPADRLKRGIISDFNLCENLLLGHQYQRRFNKRCLLDNAAITAWAKEILGQFNVRYACTTMKAGNLSGGNQQKLVVAREIQRNPTILIAAQPTRGLDIGATQFMRTSLVELKSQGKAILLVSLDLQELMSMSDRILVLFEGAIQGEFRKIDGYDETAIGFLMAGGNHD
ncbi:MAG: ABC transporter ATP-binding protein [Sphaerochaeta sp.]|nr:ABC transporter ATP-binding protein [Sphaerochaeta sp.]